MPHLKMIIISSVILGNDYIIKKGRGKCFFFKVKDLKGKSIMNFDCLRNIKHYLTDSYGYNF